MLISVRSISHRMVKLGESQSSFFILQRPSTSYVLGSSVRRGTNGPRLLFLRQSFWQFCRQSINLPVNSFIKHCFLSEAFLNIHLISKIGKKMFGSKSHPPVIRWNQHRSLPVEPSYYPWPWLTRKKCSRNTREHLRITEFDEKEKQVSLSRVCDFSRGKTSLRQGVSIHWNIRHVSFIGDGHKLCSYPSGLWKQISDKRTRPMNCRWAN